MIIVNKITFINNKDLFVHDQLIPSWTIIMEVQGSQASNQVLRCVIPECSWTYPSLFESQESFNLIKMHMEYAHPQPIKESSKSRLPKFVAPSIEAGIDQEAWIAFTIRWQQYCQGSQLDRNLQSLRLFQCASESLGNLLLKANPRITDCTPEVVLEELRRFAVIPTAKGTMRAALMKMSQDNDEQFRTFVARVQGKAQICGYSTKRVCECEKQLVIDYTHDIVKDVIVAGIADESVRTSVLEMEGLENKSLNDIISLVERKENARKTNFTTVSTMSSFKRQNNMKGRVPPKESPKIPCPRCKRPFRRFSGTNLKGYEFCLSCFRNTRSKRKPQTEKTTALLSTVEDTAALLQDVNVDTSGSSQELLSLDTLFSIDHPSRRNRDHPKITIKLCPINCTNSIMLKGVADTGAQSNVWGMQDFLRAGYHEEILETVPVKVTTVDKQAIDITGGFLAQIQGEDPHGDQVTCQAMILVSKSIVGLYISLDTLILLKVVSENFPTIGECDPSEICALSSRINVDDIDEESARFLNNGCSAPSEGKTLCGCPQRSAVPMRPKKLPFEPVAKNNGKMKRWLMEYFASSTFNTCPHRPLQEMSGPPIEIHVVDDAVPKVCHTPAPIPLHWQKQVYDDIMRDEAMGILEKVPYGQPVTWCHRLVVTRKHDGSPRRTVDLSPLNRFCTRETHGAESPYHLARRIPRNMWKTVSDAWNGYHSVPLRESDRHLTTFITPFGRWRYTRAPQGYLSSGDGYNRRFQTILEDFPRHARCVDDTIHYDESLEEHYWRTIDFLILVGQSGIVLNPDKFQFASKDVEFAGFRILSDRVEPLPKYLEAIQSFPKPRSSTDIKSWFGLVNQVSSYGQLRDTLAKFRPFLSPKTKFEWSDALDKAFEESKTHIINLIKRGVEIFDIDRSTCLRPDWSKKGIGYFLLQKHCTCDCSYQLPDCCSEGWRITVAGSRFLSDTESRYAPIEGEALAIAWGLEQTKYFSQGCDKLLVVTDHKPLVKIFGDRTLDEVTNTRLFRLKQRTLQWKFDTAYMPGRTNCAADAASRYPISYLSSVTLEWDLVEELTISAITSEASEVTAVDWKTIVVETNRDPVLAQLKQAIREGFSGTYSLIADYIRYKDSLYLQEGAVMFFDRVVIPTILRPTILSTLHAAHQGTSAMQLRAQAIIFWPGITHDIARKRDGCPECNKNSPSQAALPSKPAQCPSTPFEQIVADYFEFGGRRYLVAADRLSGFSEVFFTPTGTSNSGARGLITCLREWFRTFGVPEELSSDGGPEFTADATRGFLLNWGVRQRISSAYHPKSNGRAEVAVKTAKRLMRSNVSPSGSLDTDKFLRAMLQLRNSPDPDCGVSPAEIVFGRQLRDNLNFVSYVKRSTYSSRWQQAWAAKEEALRARFIRTAEKLNEHSRSLPPLCPGDKCFLQNQTGNLKKKWHQTGTVVKVGDHDQYHIKVDGSRRVTIRNRQFLKKFTPYSTSIRTEPAWDHDQSSNLRAPSDGYGPLIPYRPVSEEPGSFPTVSRVIPKRSPVSEAADAPDIEDLIPAETTSDAIMGTNTPSSENFGNPSTSQPKTTRREPLCLRRLRPHNKPGLKESPLPSKRRRNES